MPDVATWYQRFLAAHRELRNDYQRREVFYQVQLATGYAWGQQDGSAGERDTSDAADFAYSYGEYAALFALERIGSRRNVPDCYRLWREGKPFTDS